jgi:undecaprenyl-diphosphatase
LLPFLKSRLEWLGARTRGMLIVALLIVGGAWLFIHIASEVQEGDTLKFDNAAIRALRTANDPNQPIGPPWLEEVARDLTALGGVAVLGIVTITVVCFLWMSDKHGEMWLVIIATGGGFLLSSILKHFYQRPRPNLVAHLSQAYTSSFPSGHSMLSAVVYLTLGTLLAQFVTKRRIKAYLVSVAMMLTFLVGISRVFMGVHYPTDVLAGWSAGLAWALLCWMVARFLQARGVVEKSIDAPAPPAKSE